jgi:hypothetical protein
MVIQWRGEERYEMGVRGVNRVGLREEVGKGIGFWNWEQVSEALRELGKGWKGSREEKTMYRALKERQRELAKAGAGEALDTWEARQRYFQRRRMEDAKARPDRRLETGRGGAVSIRRQRGRS